VKIVKIVEHRDEEAGFGLVLTLPGGGGGGEVVVKLVPVPWRVYRSYRFRG
jgi:hypothetical protein